MAGGQDDCRRIAQRESPPAGSVDVVTLFVSTAADETLYGAAYSSSGHRPSSFRL